MKNTFFIRLITVVLMFAINPLYGQEEAPIQIQVQSASLGGTVKIRVKNKTKSTINIWESGNSWGWGNWTLEFFQGNTLMVFVKNPDRGFTLNIPMPMKIPGSGFVDISFDLKNGPWVSHRIPIFPTYSNDEYEKESIHGCFAILAIPSLQEAKEKDVWTGTITSPFYDYMK